MAPRGVFSHFSFLELQGLLGAFELLAKADSTHPGPPPADSQYVGEPSNQPTLVLIARYGLASSARAATGTRVAAPAGDGRAGLR